MMIDTQHIKDRIDCRTLIERDLGRSKYRSQRTYMYKCPLHHERKGYSFAVYDDHWQCFGKCNRSGDAIAWLQEYHHLTFRDACERLTSGDLPQIRRIERPEPPEIIMRSEPPDAEWQQAAKQVAITAMHTLWGKAGRRAWHYLETVRGLTEQTIINAGLGYIPGHYTEWKRVAGLNVPCGITIPWYADRMIWGIKVRRSAGQQRYQQVAGGNISGSLYLADTIQPGLPILLTEGEFDALIAQQVGEGLISAAAIGSTANTNINPRWYAKFISAPSILLLMDNDEAGHRAETQLSALSQATRRVCVPHGKDLNELYSLSGHRAANNWICNVIGYFPN